MKPQPAQPLPPPLEAAVQRLKQSAREAAQRSVESLGLRALSALNGQQREQMLSAQFELNRKLDAFGLSFNNAVDEQLIRNLGQRVNLDSPLAMDADSMWDRLRLVDDGEVEAQLSADRFAMDVSHACEWELREIEAYLGNVLPQAGTGSPAAANPLRPELLGHALVKSVNLLSERDDLRKLLMAEIGRSLSALLRLAYAAVVSDWRQSGMRPAGLSLRHRVDKDGHTESGPASLGDSAPAQDSNFPTGYQAHQAHQGHPGERGPHHRNSAWSSPYTSTEVAGPAHTGSGAHSRLSHRGRYPGGQRGAGELGTVDPGLMNLIRRLAYSTPPEGAATESHWAVAAQTRPGPSGQMGAELAHPGNLIHAHRDELRQAATGSMDHMVIDVIGFLFDQILSDPKLPPQMARLLARLQLPVLRAALGDAAFFASRRHPVRRFVNRMATLSAAYDDADSEGARAFLAKATELVNDLIEGDFEQISAYEDKVQALESFVAEQQAQALAQAGSEAATLVAQKEDEARLRQLYAERLSNELRSVSAPPFVLNFLSDIWSQVLLAAQERDARTSPPGQLLEGFKPVARALVLSVQPKVTPAQRKDLLSELPRLMRALTEGMELVAWPQDQRHQFFGQLMPAHAEALKATAARQLDINMTMRQVDNALSRPLPSRADLTSGPTAPALGDALVAQNFTADEAQRIGLVDEATVQWDGQVDINIDEWAEEPASAPVRLPGMPDLAQDGEAASGAELADQLQIGFAYQMHTEGRWRKVRLAHVSPGRSFYIFTHGEQNLETLSLTRRMLVRLCEAGRFRAFETKALLERASVRARRQLAELAAGINKGSKALH